MGDDRLLRIAREPIHESAGDDHRRVVHREPGGAYVRRRGIDQKHTGRRNRRGDRHLLDQVGESLLGQVARSGRPGLHPPEHSADAGAPKREPHDGPEHQREYKTWEDEESRQPFPR